MEQANEERQLISNSAVSEALEAARARVARAEAERAELDRIIANGREEERLLERLLSLRRNGSIAPGAEPSNGTGRVEPLGTGEAGRAVIEAVITEMETAGRPLHISDLMRLLEGRKVQIPGSGTQANLITYLRREPRIVRPTRGMYGLATWGLESMAVTRRKRRRRKRMRSVAAEERTHA